MYLTEDNLYRYLLSIFPEYEIVRNKTVPNTGIKNRPDFRIQDIKLIVEFDGYQHYTKNNIILSDYKKDIIYKINGYKIIRIPYFIQLCKETQLFLFGKFVSVEYYPHGFIDNLCVVPADFCELGLIRFVDDLEKFNYIKDEIIKSLGNKNINEVLPPSLHHLLTNYQQ